MCTDIPFSVRTLSGTDRSMYHFALFIEVSKISGESWSNEYGLLFCNQNVTIAKLGHKLLPFSGALFIQVLKNCMIHMEC